MTITETTRRVMANGTIKGTITVRDGKRKYTVRYEQTPNGFSQQWGANPEVLSRTYDTFEKLCSGAIAA